MPFSGLTYINGRGFTNCSTRKPEGGGGVLPYKRLIGMCRWMPGRIFMTGFAIMVAFSIDFTRMGSQIFRVFGISRPIQNGKILG